MILFATPRTRIIFTTVLSILVLTIGMRLGTAQDFPDRTVRIIVPAAPGGSFDILARILAQRLNERWHKPVIVENREGAGGNIGAFVVAKADPDGYTLLVWNDSLLINPHLFADVPFDPKRDFTPISLSIYVPNVLIANPKTGLTTLADFESYGRSHPGEMSYGSPGNGTPGHLSFELLKQLTYLDVTHIPYRGGGPATADVVAGHIPLGMVAVAGAIGAIRSGIVTPLAVTSEKRVLALPDTPTIAEQGVKDFQVNAWHGVLAPAGMPPRLVAQLQADVTAVLHEPAVRQRLLDLGFEPVAGPGTQLTNVIDHDFPMWGEIVERSGARAD